MNSYGRVNAEFITNGHQYSGSGGQFDFVKGAAYSKGGRSFIALKSAAKNGPISCIVPRVQMATDTRMDVEHVVTEYGCVNLRGKSTKERALVADKHRASELPRVISGSRQIDQSRLGAIGITTVTGRR